MAIVKHGILGGFSGKIGNVVGYTYRGRQVIKSLPKKSSKSPSVAQLKQRMSFGLAAKFLSPLKEIIVKAYGNQYGQKSNYNKSIAYHTKEAVEGNFPNLAINMSKVELTKGALSGAIATVETNHNNEVCFRWVDNTGMGLSKASDLSILVVHHTINNQSLYSIGPCNRASQTASIKLPESFLSDTVHCWIGFIAADGKVASSSIYLGTVVLPSRQR